LLFVITPAGACPRTHNQRKSCATAWIDYSVRRVL